MTERMDDRDSCRFLQSLFCFFKQPCYLTLYKGTISPFSGSNLLVRNAAVFGPKLVWAVLWPETCVCNPRWASFGMVLQRAGPSDPKESVMTRDLRVKTLGLLEEGLEVPNILALWRTSEEHCSLEPACIMSFNRMFFT